MPCVAPLAIVYTESVKREPGPKAYNNPRGKKNKAGKNDQGSKKTGLLLAIRKRVDTSLISCRHADGGLSCRHGLAAT